MTAQTLPDDPNYCFVPAYDIEDEVQQIRIVVDGMTGYIPTALVALTIVDGERLCDRSTRSSDSRARTGPPLRQSPCAPRHASRMTPRGTEIPARCVDATQPPYNGRATRPPPAPC